MPRPKAISKNCVFCCGPNASYTPIFSRPVCPHCFLQMRPAIHQDIMNLEAELAREKRLGMFPQIKRRLGG